MNVDSDNNMTPEFILAEILSAKGFTALDDSHLRVLASSAGPSIPVTTKVCSFLFELMPKSGFSINEEDSVAFGFENSVVNY